MENTTSKSAVAFVYIVKIWDYFIISFITEIVYFSLLFYIARNGGNKWLVMNCVLVILSVLGIAVVAYAYYHAKWLQNHSITIVIANAIGTAF